MFDTGLENAVAETILCLIHPTKIAICRRQTVKHIDRVVIQNLFEQKLTDNLCPRERNPDTICRQGAFSVLQIRFYGVKIHPSQDLVDDITVGVIDPLRKDVEGIFIDKRKQRAAGCRMDFVLGDNSQLILFAIYLISGLAIQPIQIFFCVFKLSPLLQGVTELIDRQVECGERIFSDNDLSSCLPPGDESAEIKLIWPKILQLLDQQVLVGRTDCGIDFLILITDTELNTAIVKLKEEIVLVFLLDLICHIIVKAMQPHGKLLRVCAGKFELCLVCACELLHAHILTVEIQAHGQLFKRHILYPFKDLRCCTQCAGLKDNDRQRLPFGFLSDPPPPGIAHFLNVCHKNLQSLWLTVPHPPHCRMGRLG